MIEYKQIESFILTGVKFQYESYDHKAAMKDYNKRLKKDQFPIQENIDCYNMPDDIKEKHKVFKIGKLRQIEFDPSGMMWRFKIGSHYAKTYFAQDFGVTVKPILEKKQDKHGLIKLGLAIDAKNISKK